MSAGSDDGTVPRWWVVSWACLGALIAAAIAIGPLEGIAHVQDEVVYRYQAGLLAQGRLWEPARLPRAAHHYSFILNDGGRRFGAFPNGWPAVLAAGVLVGAPWIVNPALHGITVAVGAGVAQRVGGRGAATLAAPLLALSPQLVLLAASSMSHTLAALLVLAAVACVERERCLQTDAVPAPLSVGAALGWLVLTRPLDAVVATLAVAAWIGLRHPRWLWLWALGPIVAAALLVGLQNQAYVGDPLVFPVHAWFLRGEPPFPDPAYRYVEGCNRLGFGPDRGCEMTIDGFGHTPRKAWRFAADHLQLAGRLWLGTPLMLLLVGGCFLPGPPAPAQFDRAAPRFAGWALGLTAALGLAYGLYWYGGACFGARFWHLGAPPIIVAAALGLAALLRLVPAIPRAAAYLALTPLALRLVATIPELEGYWGVDDRLDRFERRWEGGPALLLVGYGPAFAAPVSLPETTNGTVTSYSAIRRRGMWIERRGGPLRYAEYQPQLVEAIRAQHPALPVYLLVLTSDPRHDYVVPLAALPRPPQRDELPLPVTPPPFSAPPAPPDEDLAIP